jgi:WXG100 family type VII secretion target
MSQLNVNFPAMRQACDDVKSCHNALVQEKEGLDSWLKTNLDANWGGGAKDAWSGVNTEWNQACDEVNNILLQLYNALETALGNYGATEHFLEKLWGG